MIKKLMMLCFAAIAGTGAWAATNVEPRVTDVVAKQRYPWNGLVDITCKVSGIVGTTNGLKLAVAAVLPDSEVVWNISKFWIVQGGTNSTDREVHVNGNYHLLWDAYADLGVVNYSNMIVRVTFDAHDKVQLWEGGPYWATMNIGAEKPEDYGYYFWWGDIVGYKRESDKWVASDGSSTNFAFLFGQPTYDKGNSTLSSEGWVVRRKDGTPVLAPEHDAAQVHWGGGWRMPTYHELDDLNNNCDWTWTAINDVNGYVVRGRGEYASNSIFLPCAGGGNGTSLDYAGSLGHYWSSVPNGDSWVYLLSFGPSDNHSANGRNVRIGGNSIRPLQGSSK